MADKQKIEQQARLELWKDRFSKALAAYQDELAKIAKRDNAYNGIVEVKRYVDNDVVKDECKHVRNIIAEIIEAEVDTGIPQPKVTAMRKEDELRAKIIEDTLRDELDRLPFEEINDYCERMATVQGGALFHPEWDNTKRTHTTVGENRVTPLNPNNVIPQDGISEIDDMEYIFVRVPQTKEYIKRKYNVTLDAEAHEDAPEIRSADGDEDDSDALVTQYIAYFRNENGGIGKVSWVLDTELEYYDDYQARRQRVCKDCGGLEPSDFEGGKKVCPNCGGKTFEDSELDSEVIYAPIETSFGVIEASDTNPVEIPYYKPNVFPIVLQRNVTSFSRFLGNSDVDLIYDQQCTINRLNDRVIEKLLTGGTFTALPDDARIETNNKVGKIIHFTDPSKRGLLGTFDLTCDIQQELAYIEHVYREARNILNITDSFQGRNDSTATSKIAKEFAAKQTAGRLESKRQMKRAAYAKLFEIMFKFKLAYADEPRPIRAHDSQNRTTYSVFNRYDFLMKDDAGEWYWNDQFIFSCDTAAPLASNREAMWQETRMNLESGAFGDPTRLETLILFWTKMEMLHYPGAGETKSYLIEQKNAQDQMAAEQMAAQNAAMAQMESQIDAQARSDAEMAVRMQAEQDAQAAMAKQAQRIPRGR
jgi:hypothetical protein